MRSGWCGGEAAVGERQQGLFRFSFNSSLRVEVQGARVTLREALRASFRRWSDSGARAGRTSRLERTRGPALERFPPGQEYPIAAGRPAGQSIYSRLGGYEDVNDAERLSQDPTFRLIGSRKIWERGAALISRLQSFETEPLTRDGAADARGKPRRSGRAQSRVSRPGRSYRFASAHRAGYGQY